MYNFFKLNFEQNKINCNDVSYLLFKNIICGGLTLNTFTYFIHFTVVSRQ